jgi:glucose-1-phosphatase
MAIKTVIFDLGKVLVNYSFTKTFMYWSQKSGVPVETIKALFSVDEQFKLHETGEISIEDYYRHLCTALGMNMSLEDFITGWNVMFIGLYPDTMRLVRLLSGKTQKVLLSNTNKTHTVFLRAQYPELFEQLDVIFFSNEIHRRKPDAQTFQYVIETCGARAEDVLFFDDLKENIEGAQKLNINGVIVNETDSIEKGLRSYHVIGGNA